MKNLFFKYIDIALPIIVIILAILKLSIFPNLSLWALYFPIGIKLGMVIKSVKNNRASEEIEEAQRQAIAERQREFELYELKNRQLLEEYRKLNKKYEIN